MNKTDLILEILLWLLQMFPNDRFKFEENIIKKDNYIKAIQECLGVDT